jgi:hypothetical protein
VHASVQLVIKSSERRWILKLVLELDFLDGSLRASGLTSTVRNQSVTCGQRNSCKGANLLQCCQRPSEEESSISIGYPLPF